MPPRPDAKAVDMVQFAVASFSGQVRPLLWCAGLPVRPTGYGMATGPHQRSRYRKN